jgi:hypothetical protein
MPILGASYAVTRFDTLRLQLDAAERPDHFPYCSEQLYILPKIYVEYTLGS